MRGNGFSLLEVLAVVGLLAVLVLVAAPRLLVPESLQVGVAARQLAADLRLAQRLAIARRVDMLVEFSPAAPPYAQYVVRQSGGAVEPDFPKDFDGVTVAGPPQFAFRPNGAGSADGSVTVSAGGRTATVQVVAVTGRVILTGP